MRLVRPNQDPPPTPREGGPWRPNTEPYVMGKCGHVCLGWGEFKAVGKLAPDIYCDICQTWVQILSRKVTPADIIRTGGKTPQSSELPLEPPF